MNSRLGDTRQYPVPMTETNSPEEILRLVYTALKAKGYDPITQIVGYILTEDPTYITNHKNARTIMRKVDRNELLQILVRSYLED